MFFMKRVTIIAITIYVIIVLFSCQTGPKKDDQIVVLNQQFIDTLAIMAQLDQDIRKEPESEDKFYRIDIVDSTNTATLKDLIAKYGFPSWKLVGKQGAFNAWLIAQHSDKQFLAWYLKQYRKAVENNDADKSCLALMEDRNRTNEGRPQLYGSQLIGQEFFPIGNPKELDLRRESMGLCPIKDYTKNFGLDSVIIGSYFNDYQTYYYPNYLNLCKQYSVFLQNTEVLNDCEFYPDNITYDFPRDIELFALFLYDKGFSVMAIHYARKMILCGQCLNDEWYLPQYIIDSVSINYEDLRLDYERQISKDDDLMLKSITSFDTLVKTLDEGSYPRYMIDAWNNHIKNLIYEKSITLTESDYQSFFEWLYNQVERGNYHLFEYAELYDEVYYRLYGKPFYGQKSFDDDIHNVDVEKVNQRRVKIKLPTLEVWNSIQTRMVSK